MHVLYFNLGSKLYTLGSVRRAPEFLPGHSHDSLGTVPSQALCIAMRTTHVPLRFVLLVQVQ